MNNKRNTATETYITYAPETDMTFIMKGVIDADTLEHISDECIGWSYGKITIGEALNMEHSLKAEYTMGANPEPDLPEDFYKTMEQLSSWQWGIVFKYITEHVETDKQDEVSDSLYDDDDFCNDLFRCKTESDIEALLDNKLF